MARVLVTRAPGASSRVVVGASRTIGDLDPQSPDPIPDSGALARSRAEPLRLRHATGHARSAPLGNTGVPAAHLLSALCPQGAGRRRRRMMLHARKGTTARKQGATEQQTGCDFAYGAESPCAGDGCGDSPGGITWLPAGRETAEE